MKQRGPCPISRCDLRDHATQERIDRIWERIEADLPMVESAAPAPSRWIIGGIAAVAASLTAGLLLGKLIWDQPAAAIEMLDPPAVASTPRESSYEVLAAATRGQTYALPGGGQAVLSPGSILELLRQRSDGVELRLVQGDVTIDAAGVPPERTFAVFAGESLLSTQGGGRVLVRRDDHGFEVQVSQGDARLQSPQGERKLVQGEQVRTAWMHTPRPVARHLSSPLHSARVMPTPTPVALQESAPPVSNVPDWLSRGRAGDSEEALRLLRAQPGGIDGAIMAASDADSLWEIHDIAIRQDPAAACRALIRVAEAFPGDASAQLAAFKLGNYYRRAGQHELASKWFALAAQSPEGVLAEDALCKQFRTAPNETQALRFAQEYLVKYPDGRCKEEAERLIAGEASDDTGESSTKTTDNTKPAQEPSD